MKKHIQKVLKTENKTKRKSGINHDKNVEIPYNKGL